MAKTADTKAVTKPEAPASAALTLPSGMSLDMLSQDAQDFAQDFGREDLATPFLRVLQSLSPQVLKQKAEFIPGAEVGDFFLSTTNRVIKGDVGVVLIPIHFEKSHTEWKPKRGGFVADHGPSYDVDANATWDEERGTFVMNNGSGNELAVGMLYYVFVVDPETGTFEPAAFILSGSQMKKGRKWNSIQRSFQLKGPKGYFTPPSFFMAYHVTTVPESNDSGDWYGVAIKPLGPTHSLTDGVDLYERAKEMYRGVKAGTVKAKVEHSEGTTTREPGDEEFSDEEFPDGGSEDGGAF